MRDISKLSRDSDFRLCRVALDLEAKAPQTLNPNTLLHICEEHYRKRYAHATHSSFSNTGFHLLLEEFVQIHQTNHLTLQLKQYSRKRAVIVPNQHCHVVSCYEHLDQCCTRDLIHVIICDCRIELGREQTSYSMSNSGKRHFNYQALWLIIGKFLGEYSSLANSCYLKPTRFIGRHFIRFS